MLGVHIPNVQNFNYTTRPLPHIQYLPDENVDLY